MNNSDNKLSSVLIGVLYLVLGIVFIACTEELLITFNYILVSICLIIGVIQILTFIFGKKYKNDSYGTLLVGVIFIWVSLILYVYYGFMINILPILFSLYLFVMASDMVYKFSKYNGVVNVKRGKYLILAFTSIVVGLLLIFNPGSVILTYLKVTGGYLVIVGIIYFIDLFKYNNK